MCNQKTLSLFKLIEQIGIKEAQRFLDISFRCSRNPDVEAFLLKKAVRFEQADAAATHFIMNNDGQILAYFSLSFKSVEFLGVSKSLSKKLSGGLGESNAVKTFLIGQIGKNDLFENNLNLADILDVIFQKIRQARRLISGRVVILECENNPKLISLYEQHGFKLIETTDDSELKTMFIIPEFK